ncbi:MAG: formate/nitrite transporter family protein [Alphaproteobacteria bacterium]
MLHEIIREQGLDELSRRTSALWWSGLAAGLSMGMSMLAMGMIAAHLPDTEWAGLISKFGYTAGFLIVILARQQLFTENTITVLLPVVADRHWRYLPDMFRLWGVVLLANVVGAALFAWALVETAAFEPQFREATFEVAHHLMANDASAMFLKGIVAGWLIAGMVWLLPSAGAAKIWVILFVTYLIALGNFTHIVAGSAEAFALLFDGQETGARVLFTFFFPTLAGNVLGGSALFTLISYAQVRSEIDEERS